MYRWSMKPQTYIIGSQTYVFHASDYLDDTTSASPNIISLSDTALTFYLEVTDANFTSCYDTVTVTFSSFISQPVTWLFYINQGDSVQFFNPQSGSNQGFDSIYWSPSASLSDPNALRPLASPDTTTTYAYVKWDKMGCVDTTNGACIVYVDQLGSKSFENQEIKIFPNRLKPQTNLYIEKGRPRKLNFTLHSSNGQKVMTVHVGEFQNEIKIPDLPTGFYYYQVSEKEDIVKKGKILIQE